MADGLFLFNTFAYLGPGVLKKNSGVLFSFNTFGILAPTVLKKNSREGRSRGVAPFRFQVGRTVSGGRPVKYTAEGRIL